MKIRAHHLLCMQGFKRGGYNKKFEKNFIEVIKKLKTNPQIEIVNSCDVICMDCPHMKKNKCQKRSSKMEFWINQQDRDVMARLGVEEGHRGFTNDILALAKEKIRGKDLDIVCTGCEWLRYKTCINAINRENYFRF